MKTQIEQFVKALKDLNEEIWSHMTDTEMLANVDDKSFNVDLSYPDMAEAIASIIAKFFVEEPDRRNAFDIARLLELTAAELDKLED